jgi:hypothetical protein
MLRRSGAGASQTTRSASGHAERPIRRGREPKMVLSTNHRKAPFPRILSEDPSSTHPALRKHQSTRQNASPDRASRKGGCIASSSAPLKERRLRTCTDCPGFKLAISLHTVKRYKLLNRGCASACNKRRGSPPPLGLAPERRPLISYPKPDQLFAIKSRSQHMDVLSHSSATRFEREATRFDCSTSIQGNSNRTLHWESFKVPANGSTSAVRLDCLRLALGFILLCSPMAARRMVPPQQTHHALHTVFGLGAAHSLLQPVWGCRQALGLY